MSDACVGSEPRIETGFRIVWNIASTATTLPKEFENQDGDKCKYCADDVPCFPAEAFVPDVPANKQMARDVDGVLWQYDAGDDKWDRV